MSEFRKILRNDSSSDSEEGELSEDNEVLDTNQETNDNKLLDPKTLKTSKSLEIVDKMDTKRNNRFSIWSDLLIEEELNDSVSNSMDIKKRQSKTRKMDRNCENYSFWMKKQLETNSEQQLSQKTSHSDNTQKDVHKKKTKKKKKSHKDKQMSKSGDLVLEMAKKLREPKVDLLSMSSILLSFDL